jgi:hypothetical protein
MNYFNFSQFENKNPNLCFIKKYRNKGKTYLQFSNASISREVSNQLKEWLKDNFSKIDENSLVDYDPTSYENQKEKIDLGSINVWEKYKESAFTLTSDAGLELEDIKKKIIGFLVYMKEGDKIIGQARKVGKSNVLTKNGLFHLCFDNSAFNKLVEFEGIEIDRDADLLFEISESSSKGVVTNKLNFKYLLDMYEEEKNNALKLAESIKVFKDSSNFEKIKSIINNDRQLQAMLANPLVEQYKEEITIEILVQLKEEVGDEVKFSITKDKKDFILPEEDERFAAHDVVKVIANRYGRSVNDKHVIETGNWKRVLK